MFMQMIGDSPQNRWGGGQVSHLLLAPGQFGSRNLAVTWVEGPREASSRCMLTRTVSRCTWLWQAGDA